MKLKVCGMREAENVSDLIVKVKPDWMGLIFYPLSPRYVDPMYADSLGSFMIRKTGVFVDAELGFIKDKIEHFGLQTIQLHGAESSDKTQQIKNETGLEVFKVFSVAQDIRWDKLEAYVSHVDYFLFDTFTKQYGGSGKAFNWKLLKEYPFDKPFLLSGGISVEHSPDLLALQKEVPQFVGIDINSKFEIEPGLKDIGLIQKFKSELGG